MLAEAAANARAPQVEREFFDLFIGLGRGELLPYGSYYLTGFLHERPLARLREDLATLGIERVEGQAEPEDHAAILCEIMSGLAGGSLAAPAGSDRQIFERHLAPWIGRFFHDLEHAGAVHADFQYARRIQLLAQRAQELDHRGGVATPAIRLGVIGEGQGVHRSTGCSA